VLDRSGDRDSLAGLFWTIEKACFFLNKIFDSSRIVTRQPTTLMISYKVPKFVTPAKAGVHNLLEKPDSGFRRNDAKREFLTFHEGVNFDGLVKSRQTGRHSKKRQDQGARIFRNEAYIRVRRND